MTSIAVPLSPADSTSDSPVEPRGPSSAPNGSFYNPQRNHTIDFIDHRLGTGFKSLGSWRKGRNRRSTHTSLQEWELPNHPYHEYVRQCVAAGWTNLEHLEEFLSGRVGGYEAYTQPGLIVSVVDILKGDPEPKHWPNIYNEVDLKNFVETERRPKGCGSVRLYMAEYHRNPSPALIETLGASLKLDPRFFGWSIHDKEHVFTPSQRHRAPYMTLGFGVLDATTPRKTDAEKFKVLVYVQPDEEGKGWTGVILFSTHTKIDVSPRILTNPPPFRSSIPPRRSTEPRSFRELYIDSLDFTNLSHAIDSPFYAFSILLRLNCFCWNQIITAIREEDKRIAGISDTTIGHTEEIKKTLSIVDRGGSLSWPGSDDELMKESQEALKEDFGHLVDQTNLLWSTRDKMEAIRQRNSDTRWTSLTNAFTYIFAPVTIMSGIYGMNVSQISGSSSNPNIWQFFVAVAAMIVFMVMALSVSAWVQIQHKHGRKAGLKEVLKYSIGRVDGK